MKNINNIDIQVGDLVRLRDDLIDGKDYGLITFDNGLKFDGYCRVYFVDVDGTLTINGPTDGWYSKEMIAEVKRPCQYKTIYKREEILTDEEREYLSAVIKPFRDRFRDKIYFMKRCDFFDKEHMTVWVDGEFSSDFRLPSSQENTKYKYKNMKLRKRYTLEELEL